MQKRDSRVETSPAGDDRSWFEKGKWKERKPQAVTLHRAQMGCESLLKITALEFCVELHRKKTKGQREARVSI